MLKFLLIIFIVFLTAVLGLGVVFKRFLNILGVNPNKKNTTYSNTQTEVKQDKEVLYSKDDIVVLKGEAGKNKSS